MPTVTTPRALECGRAVFTKTTYPHTESQGYVSAGIARWNDSKTGSSNPGWKQQIKQHVSAGTNFAGDRWEIRGHYTGTAHSAYRAGTTGTSYQSQRFQVSGSLVDSSYLVPMDPYINVPMSTRVHNQALSEFYQHAWEAIRQFQGGVFLGEIGDALNTIRRPARNIFRLLNEYTNDVRRRARRVARGRPRSDPVFISDANKVISDTWLQYVFGLRPLMSDVKSGAEALARLAQRPREYIKTSAYVNDESSFFDDFSTFTREIYPFVVYSFSKRYSGGVTVRIVGEVKCEVTSPRTISAEVLGFTPENFVPTVWELIPYSFLVDYFTNIGDVISAWSFPSGQLAWVNRTIRNYATREYYGSKIHSVPPAGYVLDSESGSEIHFTGTRTTIARDYGPLGFPKVTLEVPGSSTKWINMGALAHMRFL
jgi:hypothetical protein